ncbi:MAG: hypothetical protein ACI9EW_002492 [Cellvibrionaceae bacterium]|jgi:hypothetical protein
MQTTSNRQREKNAIERILGNLALRERLIDDQAEELFSWAFAQIETFVAILESIPDEDAHPAIEKFTNRVILVIRCFNLLLYQLDNEIRDDDSEAACDDFTREVAIFKYQDEQAILLLQTAVNYPADWSTDSAFQFLFSFLDLGDLETVKK